jgi:hypothetical protein
MARLQLAPRRDNAGGDDDDLVRTVVVCGVSNEWDRTCRRE